MTITTLPVNVPGIALGTGLAKMFELRQELQPLYNNREGLIDYPLDLQSRRSQVVLKDFLYRTVEEVGEVYRAEVEIHRALTNNDDSNLENQLVAYNEEIADVTQFLFQLFLFANITHESVQSYYEYTLEENGLMALLVARDMLTSTFQVADHILMEEGYNNFQQLEAYSVEVTSDQLCMYAGLKASDELLNQHRIYLFDFINILVGAGNMLKNRAWRQSDTYTEGKNFQAALIEAYASWVKYCAFVGLKPKTFFELYWRKGQVNLHRFNNGY